MDDLIAFVNARLDEDEAAAKAWQSPPWREDATSWKVVGQRHPRYDNGRSETFTVIDVSGRPANFAEAIEVRWDSNGERTAHIARHDPARVLREVAAKRRMISDTWGGPDHEDMWEHHMRLLAAVYSDHPDYRPEWAPEGKGRGK